MNVSWSSACSEMPTLPVLLTMFQPYRHSLSRFQLHTLPVWSCVNGILSTVIQPRYLQLQLKTISVAARSQRDNACVYNCDVLHPLFCKSVWDSRDMLPQTTFLTTFFGALVFFQTVGSLMQMPKVQGKVNVETLMHFQQTSLGAAYNCCYNVRTLLASYRLLSLSV